MANQKSEENGLQFHEMEIDDRILKVRTTSIITKTQYILLSYFVLLLGYSETFLANSNFNTRKSNSFIIRG